MNIWEFRHKNEIRGTIPNQDSFGKHEEKRKMSENRRVSLYTHSAEYHDESCIEKEKSGDDEGSRVLFVLNDTTLSRISLDSLPQFLGTHQKEPERKPPFPSSTLLVQALKVTSAAEQSSAISFKEEMHLI